MYLESAMNEVRNQGLGLKLVGKQTITFLYYVDYHRIVLGPRRTGQRYRTPFEYAGICGSNALVSKRIHFDISLAIILTKVKLNKNFNSEAFIRIFGL